MKLGLQIWRCGIVAHPMEALIRDPDLLNGPVTWFGDSTNQSFFADPFGWVGEDGHRHVYAERYDYRTRHGTIDYFRFDETMVLVEQRPCLSEPWHLSYPYIVEDGDRFMLPEAHRSGALTLYRMGDEPWDWHSASQIKLDRIPVDATPFRHQGRWWLFYSPADTNETRMGHLHIAWAEQLAGPWTAHPLNPVRVDRSSSRPGGTPRVIDGRLMLPVQDCSKTYGGAIRPLWIDRLDDTGFAAEVGAALPLPAWPNHQTRGMHTMAALGDVTLIDVKRRYLSLRNLTLGAGQRKLNAPGD